MDEVVINFDPEVNRLLYHIRELTLVYKAVLEGSEFDVFTSDEKTMLLTNIQNELESCKNVLKKELLNEQV